MLALLSLLIKVWRFKLFDLVISKMIRFFGCIFIFRIVLVILIGFFDWMYIFYIDFVLSSVYNVVLIVLEVEWLSR